MNAGGEAGTTGTDRDPDGGSSLGGILLDQSHSHPKAGLAEWGAVWLVILGVLIGAVALILGNIWVAIPAIAITVAGVVLGMVTNIMDKTEDY